MKTYSYIFILTITICLEVISTRKADNVDPEVYMNTTALVRSKGYPCEEHQVHTGDGYILNVQRIPRGRAEITNGSGGVVLLQHGLLSCSACWVENLVNESLGFILADKGYDVWLGNSRGNTYGLQHETLDPSQDEFWAFSWDEFAKHDLPDTVDYILKQTGKSKLFYVGHSQGTEIAFAALSYNEDLANKIELFVALAPAVYLGHLNSPIRLLKDLSPQTTFNLFGRRDFLPESDFLRWLAKDFCDKSIPAVVCENILFLLGGYDFKEMNATRIPVYVGQHPAGTSVQNMIHYMQAIRTGKFQMYDFGATVNKAKYNQTTPPQYHLGNIKTPTVLFSGTADWLAVPYDVNQTAKQLNSLIEHRIIDGWEHLDFIWALHAPSKCYNYILELFERMK